MSLVTKKDAWNKIRGLELDALDWTCLREKEHPCGGWVRVPTGWVPYRLDLFPGRVAYVWEVLLRHGKIFVEHMQKQPERLFSVGSGYPW